MALLRLNEDIPKETLPRCCWEQEQKMAIHLHFTEQKRLIILIAGFLCIAPLILRGEALSRFLSPQVLACGVSLTPKVSCAGRCLPLPALPLSQQGRGLHHNPGDIATTACVGQPLQEYMLSSNRSPNY